MVRVNLAELERVDSMPRVVGVRVSSFDEATSSRRTCRETTSVSLIFRLLVVSRLLLSSLFVVSVSTTPLLPTVRASRVRQCNSRYQESFRLFSFPSSALYLAARTAQSI